MALFCTLWSCSKGGSHIDEPDDPDNPDNPTDVTLEISTTDLVFEAKGGEREFTVYCNADWTVTNESDWCTTNVTEGNGYGRVAVTVEAYSDTEDRNTNLTVKAGDKTEVLTVTQKHGDAIILSKDKFDVPQEGGEIAIEVKSNIEYQVSIPSKFQSWIKQTPESRAVTVKNFSFTVSANEAYEKREGYIVFSGNSLKDTVYVYQVAKYQLILTEDTYNIPSKGKDITVELKTNVDYEVVIPDSVNNWISLLQTKAVRTDKLNFSIAENDNADNRKAIVIIKDKNSVLSDTLYINQSQKNALILTQREYKIKTEGETISVEVKTNIDYEVVIPRTATNWITLLQTRAIRTDKIHLEIKENTSYDNRTAKIVIKDKNSSLNDTLYINQAQRDALILYKKQYNVSAVGEQISIEVRSNIECKVTIPQAVQNWIQEIPQSRGLATSTLTCKVLANPTEEVRTAKIIIQDKNSALSDTVQITQNIMTYTGDIVFKTEHDLIKFYAAGHTKIIGNVFVVEAEERAITTLQKLNNLITEIDGSLYLGCSTLTTLDGLDGLKTITDNLIIEEGAMTSLGGLQNLEIIGGNFTVNAISQPKSRPWGRTVIHNSLVKLESFKGLSRLKSIGGNFEIYAHAHASYDYDEYHNVTYNLDSKALNNLHSFEGLENLQTIGGNFNVLADTETDRMSCYAYALSALESFKGLSGLKSIGGDFKIFSENIGSSLWEEPLSRLSSFEGLENLKTISGNLEIYGCYELYDFCMLKNIVQNMSGTFKVDVCGYSPTKYQLLNGECSK